MKVLRYRNSAGNLATGDKIGIVPATRYVATSIATSTNGATRTAPANNTGGDCKANCSETARLTAVPSDCPKMRMRDDGIPATFIAQSTIATASKNQALFSWRAATASKSSIVKRQHMDLVRLSSRQRPVIRNPIA